MLKKIITSTIICILMQSCNSQKKDLAQIKLPTSKSTLINNEIDQKKQPFIYDPNLTAYEYKDSEMLTYDNNDLSNSIDEDVSATYSGKNYLNLLVNEKTKKIEGYQFHTYTKQESEKLFNSLNKKLGLPNYDDKDKIDRHVVWEDENEIYVFNIGYNAIIQNIKTDEVNLIVLNNQLDNLIMYINSTTYYEAYLKERKKKNLNVKNYSYSVFAKEQSNKGNKYYLKGI
ncbi:hypothetical protein BSF41_27990 [Flavobacterium sp. ACN2]|uniref:hypothetical protein n=1 Tax=unclassified Flavobacterium TaxID=196869 RepID=UPI0011436BF4|nr:MULTISPECIES: hypothetical protein [unclassified Flavobacterium]MDY0989541.1 hypothetical protein [Flavobacterium sp. CFBP9031]PBI87928.1 hypothetical protein BSF41_27990 [Flavobacterium sp. ACN2]